MDNAQSVAQILAQIKVKRTRCSEVSLYVVTDKDLSGHARIVGGTVDIGCYEYCSHAATNVINAVSVTCTTDGYTGDTVCAACGEVFRKGSVIAALDHKEAEGVIVLAPTYYEEGEMDYLCSICQALLRTEVIPMLDAPADGVYTGTVDDVTWEYIVKAKYATIDRQTVDSVGTVVIPAEIDGVRVNEIARNAFRENVELTSITIPSSITNIGYFAFRDCLRLAEVKFLGNRPHVDLGAFMGVPAYAVVSSKTGSVTAVLPTEVNGDVVSVPEGWLDEISTRHKGDTPAGYSSYEEAFAAKYGSDLIKALVKPTGKRDTQGNAMYVWQDFVAGTDPLDEEDTFQATVTLEDGVPVVRWLPELTAAEAAKRSYKTYAKTALKDGAEWTDVSALTDEARQEAGYQFFKVTVEMK